MNGEVWRGSTSAAMWAEIERLRQEQTARQSDYELALTAGREAAVRRAEHAEASALHWGRKVEAIATVLTHYDNDPDPLLRMCIGEIRAVLEDA